MKAEQNHAEIVSDDNGDGAGSMLAGAANGLDVRLPGMASANSRTASAVI
jgi:hypothetical protein